MRMNTRLTQRNIPAITIPINHAFCDKVRRTIIQHSSLRFLKNPEISGIIFFNLQPAHRPNGRDLLRWLQPPEGRIMLSEPWYSYSQTKNKFRPSPPI